MVEIIELPDTNSTEEDFNRQGRDGSSKISNKGSDAFSSGGDDDDDDDEESWLPLISEASTGDTLSPGGSNNDNLHRISVDMNSSTMPSAIDNHALPRTARTADDATTGSTNSSQRRPMSQPNLQRLETRLHLKSNLVNHPMDMFWKRFLWHTVMELWALEWHVRLGLGMVVMGMTTKLFLFSTFYLRYPRTVLLTVLLLAGTIYVDPFHLQHQFDNLGHVLGNPELLLTKLQRIDSSGLRRLTVMLLLVPTALEMRTLSFLSSIKAETGWTMYNVMFSCTLLGSMLYWFHFHQVKPRECLYRGLLILYGSALWVTMYKTHLSRLPVLAAPFLTATGTLLITFRDDDMQWMSRVLRQALRLALRDVLASLGTKVSQDEMLQLAILRWLADYWASAEPPAAPTTNARPADAASSGSQHQPPSAQASSSSFQTEAKVPSTTPSTLSLPPLQPQSQRRSSTSSILQRRQDVTWDELLPMLNVTADYMTSEVQMLQSPSESHPSSSSIPSSNSNRPSASTAPSSSSSVVGSAATTTQPMNSFQDLLQSWNIDDRAEPAVRAYQRAVESFPPSQETAFLLSIVRRCPALLTILWSMLWLQPGFVTSTLVLLPFVVLEYHRIMVWMQCCVQVKGYFELVQEGNTSSRFRLPPPLADADPMVLFLVGDSYDASRPPALLLVWKNVLNSVSALQVGLTAARCAETTAVAVQFAGNVLSLVQLGHEIHQYGILHGLMVMGKELLLMHTMADGEHRKHDDATKYTQAAISAVENAQRVAHNVQRLADNGHVGPMIQPVVWAVCTVSGYGWLWGKTDEQETASESAHDEAAISDEAATSSTPGDDTSNGQRPTDEPDVQPSDSKSKGVRSEKPAKEIPLPVEPKQLVRSSAVMEMVLAAYYRGLINQTEKTAFCQRLAELSDEERTDPDMVGGMMRTLTAILESGEVVVFNAGGAVVESSPSTNTPESNIRRVQGDTTEEEVAHASPMAFQTSATVESSAAVCSEIPQKIESSRSNSVEQQGTAEEGHGLQGLIRLGTATLSVVVGGLLASRRNNHDRGAAGDHDGEQSNQRRQDDGEDQSESTRSNYASTVVIEEIEEENENAWISVPQKNNL